MGFYKQIAPYYDYIFPAGAEQLQFIRNVVGEPPKKLLDIACGTGIYSVRLSQLGYDLWACDIDAEMVRRAEIKAKGLNTSINLFVSDMLQLEQHVNEKFDCVFCIGNSIVHLGTTEAILSGLIQMKKCLSTAGKLVLQIINFDRILEKGITALPTITNEEAEIEFSRYYSLDRARGLIYFDTVLNAKKEGRLTTFKNRVELFPLVSSKMADLLHKAGFNKVELFGGFNHEPYIAKDSFLLVVKALY